jgi:hypothetical protein
MPLLPQAIEAAQAMTTVPHYPNKQSRIPGSPRPAATAALIRQLRSIDRFQFASIMTATFELLGYVASAPLAGPTPGFFSRQREALSPLDGADRSTDPGCRLDTEAWEDESGPNMKRRIRRCCKTECERLSKAE